MEFIIDKIKYGHRGVYGIIVDNLWFYIGSSKDIQRRFYSWKSLLSKGECTQVKINKVVSDTSIFIFKVLKEVEAGVDPKIEEDIVLSKLINDPYCLNVEYSSFTNKKVARFDCNGNLIDICQSIQEMSRVIGSGRKNSVFISDVTKGNRSSFKGFIFKLVNSDGSFQDTGYKIQQKGLLEKRKVIQINTNGEVIAIHKSAYSASKILKCSDDLIRNILNKKPRCHTAKGFKFEYAE